MRDVAPNSIAANGLAAVLAMARGDPEAAVVFYAGLRASAPDHPGCRAALAGASRSGSARDRRSDAG